MPIDKWEKDFIIKSSIVPFPGVETHIHPYPGGCNITTTIQIGNGIQEEKIHDPVIYPKNGY
jgi:hypothetical protein